MLARRERKMYREKSSATRTRLAIFVKAKCFFFISSKRIMVLSVGHLSRENETTHRYRTEMK